MRSVLALVVVGSILTAGCVGPARSESDYRADIANTAQTAISAVEGAQLIVQALVEGKAAAPYVSRRLTEDEQEIQAAITAFGSVQPPTEQMDRVRSDVLALLEEASGVLGEMRIAAFRDDPAQVISLAQPLPEISSSLGRYRHLGGG